MRPSFCLLLLGVRLARRHLGCVGVGTVACGRFSQCAHKTCGQHAAELLFLCGQLLEVGLARCDLACVGAGMDAVYGTGCAHTCEMHKRTRPCFSLAFSFSYILYHKAHTPQACARTHIHTHTHISTHMHAHTHTNTHSHTHTHTRTASTPLPPACGRWSSASPCPPPPAECAPPGQTGCR